MSTQNATPPKLIYHLMPVAKAAEEAGLSTKLFLVAAAAGQLGNVEILQIGTSQYVRGSSLFDFLEDRRAKGTASGADVDLFAAEPRT
ncbi:hypothetical protein [Variovorax sp. GT1P44]|uniref:hypothetical protein n=1 Tax=Variovorax sp. GT1P44 TaxID=3443742 RepID=UPI003F457EE3